MDTYCQAAPRCAVMCEGVTVRYKSHEEQKDTLQLRSTNHLPNPGQPFKKFKIHQALC